MSLADKVAIVTGSSSGIGAAIAEKFAAEGARVAIVGRNQTKLEALEQSIRKIGTIPLVIQADVTNEKDAKKIIRETIHHFGKIDILVNNAGIGLSSSIIANNAMECYDKVMATNLRSCVFLTHLATPHIVWTKGNIINISSKASIGVLGETAFAYATSKAALDHFTRCVALELAPQGVRVNTINPGPVKTDILANAGVNKVHEDMAWDTMRNLTVLDRVAEPEEIADLAVFLASDKARSITGSALITDNGVLLK